MNIQLHKGDFLKQLYYGDMTNEQRNGFGIQIFLNGDIFVGFWENNNCNGIGTFLINEGAIFHGQFRNSNFQKGEIIWNKNIKFEVTLDQNEYFQQGKLKVGNDISININYSNKEISDFRLFHQNQEFIQDFNKENFTPYQEKFIKYCNGIKCIFEIGEYLIKIEKNGQFCIYEIDQEGQKNGEGLKIISTYEYERFQYNNNIKRNIVQYQNGLIKKIKQNVNTQRILTEIFNIRGFHFQLNHKNYELDFPFFPLLKTDFVFLENAKEKYLNINHFSISSIFLKYEGKAESQNYFKFLSQSQFSKSNLKFDDLINFIFNKNENLKTNFYNFIHKNYKNNRYSKKMCTQQDNQIQKTQEDQKQQVQMKQFNLINMVDMSDDNSNEKEYQPQNFIENDYSWGKQHKNKQINEKQLKNKEDFDSIIQNNENKVQNITIAKKVSNEQPKFKIHKNKKHFEIQKNQINESTLVTIPLKSFPKQSNNYSIGNFFIYSSLSQNKFENQKFMNGMIYKNKKQSYCQVLNQNQYYAGVYKENQKNGFGYFYINQETYCGNFKNSENSEILLKLNSQNKIQKVKFVENQIFELQIIKFFDCEIIIQDPIKKPENGFISLNEHNLYCQVDNKTIVEGQSNDKLVNLKNNVINYGSLYQRLNSQYYFSTIDDKIFKIDFLKKEVSLFSE